MENNLSAWLLLILVGWLFAVLIGALIAYSPLSPSRVLERRRQQLSECSRADSK